MKSIFKSIKTWKKKRDLKKEIEQSLKFQQRLLNKMFEEILNV